MSGIFLLILAETEKEREREVEASLTLAAAAIAQSQLMAGDRKKFHYDKKKEKKTARLVPASHPISHLRVQLAV